MTADTTANNARKPSARSVSDGRSLAVASINVPLTPFAGLAGPALRALVPRVLAGSGFPEREVGSADLL